MRTYTLPVRITRTRKCREGFYVLFNGTRLHHKTRALALAAVDAILSLQKIQVVTVREYAARRKHHQKVSAQPTKVDFYTKGGEKVAFEGYRTEER